MEKLDDICGLKKAACAAYYNNEFIKQKTLCLGAKVLMFRVQLSLSIIISMSSSEKCQNINFMAMDINTITIVITMEGTDNIKTEKVTRTQSMQTIFTNVTRNDRDTAMASPF